MGEEAPTEGTTEGSAEMVPTGHRHLQLWAPVGTRLLSRHAHVARQTTTTTPTVVVATTKARTRNATTPRQYVTDSASQKPTK